MLRNGKFLPTTIIALLVVVAALEESACLGADGQEPAAVAEGAALQKKVIAAIRENYRRLPVVHCQLRRTTLDSRVTEKKVITGKTDRGATFEYTMEPRTIAETELILSGRSLRAETHTPGEGGEWTHTMHKGIWTSYHPESKWAARCYRPDMGGVMNYDPRNFGAAGQKEVFLQEFGTDRVTRHETVKTAEEERLVLHMERMYADAGVTAKYRAEFDPARSFLPRRFVRYHTDNSGIISVLDIEYQKIEANSAWFLQKSVQRFFANKRAESADQKGWTQQETIEVVGAPRTDETFADTAFEVAIDPGIPLRDNTRGRKPPPEDEEDGK